MSGLKLKVWPQFPAQVIGGDGINVVKGNGVYTISIDVDELQEIVALTDPPHTYIMLWNATANRFAKMSLPNLKAALAALP